MADLKFNIECPNCGRTMKIPAKEMHPGNSVTCNCGCEIQFEGDDMRKAQSAWDDLEHAWDRLGKSASMGSSW
jgi:hypothetical protein